MKPKPVKKGSNADYPTLKSFVKRHRVEISTITAAVGLMVLSGCGDSSTEETTEHYPMSTAPEREKPRVYRTMGVVALPRSPVKPPGTKPGRSSSKSDSL